MKLKKLRTLLLLLVIIGIGGLLRTDILTELFTVDQDFIQYWAAFRLLIDKENMYNPDILYEFQKRQGYSKEIPMMMWNPPWILTILSPILFLPYKYSVLIWFLINLAFFVISSIICFKIFSNSSRSVLSKELAPFILIFLPALSCLKIGQISLLLTMALVICLYYLKEGRYLLAGLFSAILTIKFHLFIIMACVLILNFKRKSFFRFVLGFVIFMSIIIIPLLLVNQISILFWIKSTISSNTLSFGTPSVVEWIPATLISWLRILFRDLFSYDPTFLLWLFPLVGLVISLKFSIRFKENIILLFLFAVTSSLVFSPYGWIFDFSVLLPTHIFLLANANNKIEFFSLVSVQFFSLILGAFIPNQNHHYYAFYPSVLLFLLAFKVRSRSNNFDYVHFR